MRTRAERKTSRSMVPSLNPRNNAVLGAVVRHVRIGSGLPATSIEIVRKQYGRFWSLSSYRRRRCPSRPARRLCLSADDEYDQDAARHSRPSPLRSFRTRSGPARRPQQRSTPPLAARAPGHARGPRKVQRAVRAPEHRPPTVRRSPRNPHGLYVPRALACIRSSPSQACAGPRWRRRCTTASCASASSPRPQTLPPHRTRSTVRRPLLLVRCCC